jgi:cytochrome c oxidase subunit II
VKKNKKLCDPCLDTDSLNKDIGQKLGHESMRVPRITPNLSAAISAVVLIVLASLWIGQHSDWLMPVAADREAKLVDDLFTFMLVIASAIFLGVQGVLLYSAFAFRRKPGDMTDGPPLEGNIKLEILWTLIPTVLVLYLSVYSYTTYLQLGAAGPMETGHLHLPGSAANAAPTQSAKPAPIPLEINVQAMQFAWIFDYPKGIETGELHVPLGQPILLKMKSNDVIHGFWVPEFRIKQDVIPGRTTTVRFTPTRTGQYVLNCTQLCGTSHGVMRADVFVDKPEDYQKWLKSQAALPAQPRTAKAFPESTVISQVPLQTEQTRALVGNLRTQEQ